MSKKKELGQFYTTNSKYITEGLLDIFPKGATIRISYTLAYIIMSNILYEYGF